MDPREERKKYVGVVVHYEGERGGGAYIASIASRDWSLTAQAMMYDRPGTTICIEPVTHMPTWVEI